VRCSLAAGGRGALRTYLDGDPIDEPAEVVFYCPRCSAREFGGD
jgi:hypothetical protein